ncbi:MAG: BamA/TamA family outer membrane protein [Bryobacteraceae bacterium]
MAAAAQDYEGKRIGVILFVPEEQPLSPQDLHQILPLKANTPLEMEAVQAAVERLYATGRYTNIQVDAEIRNDEVVVRFLTENSWFIGRVSVAGEVGEPPNLGQLANATRLSLGEPFRKEDLSGAIDGVKNLLQSNGYHESHIEPRFHHDPRTQQVSIEFVVETPKRAKFSHPVIVGEPQMPEDKVVDATKWKGWFGWKPATQNRLQRGLENVRTRYVKDDRLMASVSLMEMHFEEDERRVQPTLYIDGGPKIEVRIIGAKISQGRVRRLIPIYEERAVDRDLLVEGARNLRDYLQSEGYFQVEVEFKQQRVQNDKAFVDYLINLGRRHKLVNLEIEGNRYFDTETIRERMFITPSSLQFRRGRYSESFLRRDEEAVGNLYRSNGFRDVKIASEITEDYKGERGALSLKIVIDEGPQWFVSNLEVMGISEEHHDRVLGMLSSTEGQPFSELNIAIDRDNVLADYFNGGYADATFEWSYRESPEPQRMDLRFRIEEGKRQFVNQVLISGLEATKPSLVHQNILLNPGDPLSQARMADTQKRLYDLGVFAKVDMAIQNPEGDTPSKYVLYQMEEARRYSLTAGFGAELGRIGGSQASFDAPAGAAGFSPRVSLNFSRLNMLGLGHTLSFRSRLSVFQRRGLVNYSAPRFRNNPNLNLSFATLYDDSRDVRTFAAQRAEGSVQLSQKLSKPSTVLYRFAYRRVNVDSSTLKIDPLLIPLLSQPVRVGIFSGTYIQDRRDDPADSRKGIYNTVDTGLASNIFGSQADFYRLLLRNNTYHPIGRKLVLARSGTFGWIKPLAGGQSSEIPLPERFFSGGGTSHRGFPENQAGPRDEVTGFPLGGSAQFFHSLELRYPLLGDNIGGVLFHDFGNVFSRLGNFSFRVTQRDDKDFDYMVHAVGIGLRYRTPIGPVRVDLAYAPNSPRFFGFAGTRDELFRGEGVQTDQRINRFQFHFSIGQTF